MATRVDVGTTPRDDSALFGVFGERWLKSNPTSSPLRRAIRAYRALDRTQLQQERPPRIQHKRAIQLNATQLARLVERYQTAGLITLFLQSLLLADRQIDERPSQLLSIDLGTNQGLHHDVPVFSPHPLGRRCWWVGGLDPSRVS
jgi:hypothetical protein